MTQQTRMTGRRVMDVNGQTVGKVTDVLSDDRTMEPQWAVVTYGLFNNRHRVVPASSLHAPDGDSGEQLVVAMEKDIVRHAPSVRAHAPLTGELQRELRDYYGKAA